VLSGYEFVGSVTAKERFAGAIMVTITVRLNMSPFLRAPPSWVGGMLRVMLPHEDFGLCLYWA